MSYCLNWSVLLKTHQETFWLGEYIGDPPGSLGSFLPQRMLSAAVLSLLGSFIILYSMLCFPVFPGNVVVSETPAVERGCGQCLGPIAAHHGVCKLWYILI